MAKYKVKAKGCQLKVKVKFSFREKINDFHLNFFSEKYIRGLLKVQEKKRNHLDYYGPIGISLYDRLKKPITKYEFLFIMEQIIDMTQKLNLNSLVIGNVTWDIRYVFINETTKELQFIYLPIENNNAYANIIGFMEQIIYAAKPMQEADMGYVSRYVYFIKSLPEYDAEKIEKFISSEDRSVVNTIKRHNVGQSGFMTDKPQHYYEHYDNKDKDEATGLLNNGDDEATGLLNGGDNEATGLLYNEDEEATGLLNESVTRIHYASMHRLLTDETFLINKPVFRIGKERSYSDYFVANNNMVSRSHADIISRSGKYYILDLNSKNGTFVNGVPIPAQQEVEIHNGDAIRLANEEFEFRT
ncbi:MAG: FHA domain-containing protein [Lachnospira sp.]